MSVLRPGGFGRRLLPCFRGSFPLYRFRSPIGRERPLHFGAMGTGQGPRFLFQLLAHQRPPDIPRLYAPFGHGSLAPPSYRAKPKVSASAPATMAFFLRPTTSPMLSPGLSLSKPNICSHCNVIQAQ